jgi:hypothetical protein
MFEVSPQQRALAAKPAADFHPRAPPRERREQYLACRDALNYETRRAAALCRCEDLLIDGDTTRNTEFVFGFSSLPEH